MSRQPYIRLVRYLPSYIPPEIDKKILLFSVAAQKVEKIKVLCKTLGISVQQVEKSDYGQKLGAKAGITGFKKDG